METWPIVLIAEDYQPMTMAYSKQFKDDEIDVRITDTLEGLRRLLAECPSPKVIVLGLDKTPFINQADFVRELRETYTGPLVATHDNAALRNQLMDFGCDYDVQAKFNLHTFVRELLSANPPKSRPYNDAVKPPEAR